MKKFFSFVFAFIFLFVLILVTIFVLKVGWQLTQNINETQKTLVVVSLTLLAPIVGSYITNRQSKIKEFDLRNREKKEHAYENFVELLYQFLSAKKGNKKEEEKRNLKLLEARKEIIVWGSDDFVKYYSEFMKYTQNIEGIPAEEASKLAADAFENVIKSIRKDLGYKNQKFTAGDIQRYFR